MRAAISQPVLLPPSTGRAARRSQLPFSLALLLLAFVLIWICRAYGPAPFARWVQTLPIESATDLAVLIGAVLCAMLIHEAGHLAASLTLGFKVLGGSLGPLQAQGLHGKWKISVSDRSFFSGSVSAAPLTMDHWRAVMLMVVAAGPLATLAAALYAGSMHRVAHIQVLFQSSFIQVSSLIFFLGLIPNSPSAPAHNDARLFLDLALGNSGANEIELNLRLTQEIQKGSRPQDYPMELIQSLAAWRGRPESQVAFAQAVTRWALDSDEIALAEAWDLYAMAQAEQCSAQISNHSLASSACLDVIYREDMEAARQKFERVDLGALFPPCFEERTRAAHQVALGRPNRASPHIIRAQYALPHGVPFYQLERRLLEALHLRVLGISERSESRSQSATA